MSPETEHLAQLIAGVSENLHREMHAGFTRVTERLDLIETRLDRQSGLIEERVRRVQQKDNENE